jgi:serine/threonine protein kinase
MSSGAWNLLGLTVAGRFRLERTLGEGGMGAVFEATQLSLGRAVAVKVIKPQLAAASAEEAARRFERETAIIARLNHPNIVQVVDGGRADDGMMFLAMELVDGDNLRSLLRREGTLELGRALTIAEDVFAALAAAHDAGIIHRDLKAENVMVVRVAGRAELAKVLDFGVAKLTSTAAAPVVTGSGFVAGTPGSIAPEQMLGTSDDVRSDLYSVGVLLFELLAGQPPFSGATTMELMLRHLNERAPRVDGVARQRGRTVPAPVTDFVAALLEKDPGRRPESARAALAQLATLRQAAGASTPAPTPAPAPAPAPAPLPPPSELAAFGSRIVAPPPIDDLPGALPPMTTAAATSALSVSPPEALATTPSTAPGSFSTPPHGPREVSADTSTAIAAATSVTAATSPTAPAVAVRPPARTGGGPLLVLGGIGVAMIASLVCILGGMFYARHEADRPSLKSDAATELTRAINAFYDLRIDEAGAAVERAIELDPDGAAMAYLLRAQIVALQGWSLEIADADNVQARTIARRRRGNGLLETDTERLARALTVLDPTEAFRTFAAHSEWSSCQDPVLHTLLFATRLTAVAHTEKSAVLFEGADPAHQHLLTIFGVTLTRMRVDDSLAKSRAIVDTELLPRGSGNRLVEQLVTELELREGRTEDARKRLRALVAVTPDWRARLWLDSLDAGTRASWPEDVLRQVRQVLPQGSTLRPDLLDLAGHALAGEGRIREASTLWNEAVAECADDVFGGVQKADIISLAQLSALYAGELSTAEQWRARYDVNLAAEIAGDNPGAERVRGYNLVAGILTELASRRAGRGNDAIDLAERLRKLEKVRQDVPMLYEATLWHTKVAAGDFTTADALAAQLPQCWGVPFAAIGAVARLDDARRTGAGPALEAARADAIAKLDATTDLGFIHRCVTRFDILGALQKMLVARALIERATLAREAGDAARVTATLARFDALWPHPDEHLPLTQRARALRVPAATTTTSNDGVR